MSAGYELVVGLEVHAELNTQSKIFCACRNAFGEAPNTLCCPVCAGMPGALPLLNERVVDAAVLLGLALECRINTHSRMARKHYFYPDLPKAYQITQADAPICENGCLTLDTDAGERRVGIGRIHMEEDAGKLLHEHSQGTLIDYNRCGVPLLEIVTRPDLRSADEAKACMEAIAAILLALGISDVKMQEGSLRADVNVSLRRPGEALGARVEMKNVNSFGGVQRAVAYEAKRQAGILEEGGRITGETRRWDDMAGRSQPLRNKGDAADYRFMPEPDLPCVVLAPRRVEQLRAGLPELPRSKQRRYQKEYKLSPYDAAVLTARPGRARFFEAAVAPGLCSPKAVANWLTGDVMMQLRERGQSLDESPLTPRRLAELAAMVEAGEITGAAAKRVLGEIMARDAEPRQVVEALNLTQIGDEDALRRLAQEVLAAHPGAVADYRAGKAKALGFLVGQCMKESRGRGNPESLRAFLQEML